MSTSTLQPIKVWGKGGPNPPKVAVLVAELGIPNEVVPVSFADIKQEPYITEINPNGRMPAIQDPNTGITLWETGSIYEYLVERYDTDRKLSFQPGTKEAWIARTWLYFQASGQGPYYGQAAWFTKFHPEQLPSAIERYVKEIHRVTGVLETHLKKRKDAGEGGADGPWLVGDNISYVDLAWVSWQTIITKVITTDKFDPEQYPTVKEWLDKMYKRAGVRKGLDLDAKQE